MRFLLKWFRNMFLKIEKRILNILKYCNFKIDDFEMEIFEQNVPTQNQNGYKHMLIEHQILKTKGENFRLEIIKLKQEGYKTEPAFGLLLGLKDDPYLELLEYKF